jgi:hypothetical protein
VPDAKLQSHLSRLEAPELIGAAFKIAGFDLGKRPTYATAANISGVRTRTLTFSQRRDSRTIFATDSRYGHLRKDGAWTGPDRPVIVACRRVLRAARIPVPDIAGIDVVSEYGAVAERLSEKEVRLEEPELLRKLAYAGRAAEGLPVWSSHVIVGLTRKGLVGHLELHWPRLPPEVIKEAQVLQAMVRRGFAPRELPGARIESIEAGIIHSPAVGFFIDVTAAIRVVYVGNDPLIGRKPTLYLDRHGELVRLPRDMHPAKYEHSERAAPRSANQGSV